MAKELMSISRDLGISMEVCLGYTGNQSLGFAPSVQTRSAIGLSRKME